MVQEKLTAIIQEVHPALDPADYTGENSSSQLLLSSIQMMNLMLRIENTFDITIDFEEVDITKLNSFAAFELLINQYLNR
jgi:acyl carrier protein